MATIKELLKDYNKLAITPIKRWNGSKVNLEILLAEARREIIEADTGEKLTIRQVAEDALVVVVGKDQHGNELGHPYADIITIVRGFFPEAETTARSLAWYASKMRCADTHVPYRPRARRS